MCCNYFPEKKLTKWCNGVFSNFDPVCCFVRIDMMVFWYAPSCECCVCVAPPTVLVFTASGGGAPRAEEWPRSLLSQLQ